MSKIKRKIDDFGEFVPGCFKHHGAMSYDEFIKMSEAEQRLRAKRDAVWASIDGEALVEEGEDNFLVYLKYRIRRLTHSAPKISDVGDFATEAAKYVKSLAELRDAVMSVKTESQMMDLLINIRKHHSDWNCCIDFYRLYTIQHNFPALRIKCTQMNYPYNSRKKPDKKKESFKLAPLEKVEREGTDYRNGIDATEKKWEDTFQYRGVVFGASVPQKERKDDLNYGYDGMMDMVQALGIANEDISFGGKLNISFAARGRGHASGHYEIIGEVINMTRLHGAGTFAKLWFHALDDALAKFCGITSGHLASEADEKEKEKLPPIFNALIHHLKYDADGNETAFFIGSRKFDDHFKKNFYGRWGADAEMASRAFACYLKDCIGCKSDYIIAHADSYHWEFENEALYAIPQGEERELFNELFDMLIYALKEIGFFHNRPTEKPKKPKKTAANAVVKPFIIRKVSLSEEPDGQYKLF